ncbi:MAG: hypothetical protein QNJ40_16230 [Xanthomonadales bacterium]|nr:hypothetical protein [Xanthomonadales bacterium]
MFEMAQMILPLVLSAAEAAPVQGLSAADLVEASLDIADRLDFQWGLFITVHLALFGAVIYVDRPLKRAEKAGAILIYAGFAALSYRLMLGQVALLEQAYADIATLASPDSRLLTHMAAALHDGKLEFASGMIVWGHIIMLGLVVLSLIFDRALTHVVRGVP